MSNEQTVNKQLFAWSQISVSLLGRTIEGIMDISYANGVEHAPVYGRGKKPIGYTEGNESYEGSITLTKEEVNAIRSALPSGRGLTDIEPFSIAVSYESKQGILITDRVIAKFAKQSFSASSGSTDALVEELPLYVVDIQYNV